MLPGHIALEILSAGEAVTAEKTRCIRMRFAGSGCRRCVEACPQQAITLEPGPAVDSARCGGCLLCESACPTGAFASGDQLIHTLASLCAVASPVLGCSRRQGVEAHTRVGCLGLLASPEILLTMSIRLPHGVTLNLTRCGECPNGSIVSRIKTILEDLADLPGQSVRTAIRLAEDEETLRFREKDLSRRDFFSFFRSRSAEAAADALDRLQKSNRKVSCKTKELPQRRSLLLGAMPSMAGPLRQAVEKRLFPQAAFRDSCRACSGCVGICPTGALEPPAEHGAAPGFELARCTDCRLCEAFCRRGGITLTRRETVAGDRD